MSKGKFFNNPDFLEYVRLLRDLHVAIRNGNDESEEPEQIRDKMDEPGSRLSSDEIASVQGVSADFYSLAEPASEPIQSNAMVLIEFTRSMEARDSSDFPRALDLIRRCSGYLKPAAVAAFRGTIWMAAKEYGVASLFLDRAAKLEPDNPNYRSVALHALFFADPSEAKRQAKDILENAEGTPPRLVLIAWQIRFLQAQELSPEEARAILSSLPAIMRNVMARMVNSGEDQTLPEFYRKAYGLLGICYERLGDPDEALRCFNQGLTLAPDNPSLLAARGMLVYAKDTPNAVRDLEAAVERGTSLVGPYYFLAYHSLSSADYRRCLNLSHEGLRHGATDSVRANFCEFIAISSASLGEPAPIVEALFQAATDLAPNNLRIRRNYQLYKQDHSLSVNWQKDSPDEVRRFGWEELNPTPLIAA